jgi:integrase
MKGSVYKAVAPNGRVSWRYQVDGGRDENGKRARISKSGFKLEREAYGALREKMQELKGGIVAKSGTLKEFIEEWLPYHTRAKPLAPITADRYASLAAHATSALGKTPLSELTTFMLDDLYVKLGEKLSGKTIREVHGVLHVALKRAVKTKLIRYNPSDGCDLPRVDQREAVALNPEQLSAFEAVATGTWVDLLIRLGGAIGARRGELLATRWADINWPMSKIRIERSLFHVKKRVGTKPTKTRQAREVVLPASLIEYLKLHREKQNGNRRMYGVNYRTDLDLVFADPAGNYLRPTSVSRAVVRLAKKAGLQGVGMHTLRHTHASVLLAAGVPITNVSKRLGHRDAYTTAKIYAHALPDSDQDVAAKWESLRSEKPRPKGARAHTGHNRDSNENDKTFRM